MGYTTDFSGKMTCTPKLTEDQIAYINLFSQTRRMARDEEKCSKMSDPVREKVGLPVGVQGEFFVGGLGYYGQDGDPSVLDHNSPSSTQPGLWCQWEASENGKHISWNGAEKFYYYTDWLEYLQKNVLDTWGVKLNGKIKWRGEDSSDRGVLLANNGEISSKEGEEYKEFLDEQKRIKKALAENKDISKEVDPIKEQKSTVSIRQKM